MRHFLLGFLLLNLSSTLFSSTLISFSEICFIGGEIFFSFEKSYSCYVRQRLWNLSIHYNSGFINKIFIGILEKSRMPRLSWLPLSSALTSFLWTTFLINSLKTCFLFRLFSFDIFLLGALTGLFLQSFSNKLLLSDLAMSSSAVSPVGFSSSLLSNLLPSDLVTVFLLYTML